MLSTTCYELRENTYSGMQVSGQMFCPFIRVLRCIHLYCCTVIMYTKYIQMSAAFKEGFYLYWSMKQTKPDNSFISAQKDHEQILYKYLLKSFKWHEIFAKFRLKVAGVRHQNILNMQQLHSTYKRQVLALLRHSLLRIFLKMTRHPLVQQVPTVTLRPLSGLNVHTSPIKKKNNGPKKRAWPRPEKGPTCLTEGPAVPSTTQEWA